METNDRLHPDALAAVPNGVRSAFLAELNAFISERASRYTMGDSLSVTEKTGARLVDGVLYPIELHLRLHHEDAGLFSVRELYGAGVSDIRRLCARGRLLLKQAEKNPPGVHNAAYAETFAELSAFFKRYDVDFFAREIPCSIDYPLCRPVPETLGGIEFVNEYLRRLCIENEFLAKFPAAAVLRRLVHAVSYDAELVVNLVSPVLDAAVGCALTGADARSLIVPIEAGDSLVEQFQNAEAAKALPRMEQAACRLFDEMHINSESARSYLGLCALDLLPRLCAAAHAGSVNSLF